MIKVVLSLAVVGVCFAAPNDYSGGKVQYPGQEKQTQDKYEVPLPAQQGKVDTQDKYEAPVELPKLQDKLYEPAPQQDKYEPEPPVPVQEYKPPQQVEEYKPPQQVDEYKPPAQEYKPPTQEYKPPEQQQGPYDKPGQDKVPEYIPPAVNYGSKTG